MIVFFPLVEMMFQENPTFGLVETDFRANHGFHKIKEKLETKEYCFYLTKIVISPAGIKDSLEKYVYTTPKNCFHLQEYI